MYTVLDEPHEPAHQKAGSSRGLKEGLLAFPQPGPASSPESSPLKNRRTVILVGVSLMLCTTYAQRASFSVALEDVRDDLDWSDSQVCR